MITLSVIKELVKEYGEDKTLGEALELFKSKKVKSIYDISIGGMRVYGKCCYELSGESSEISDSLGGFIDDEELFGLYNKEEIEADEADESEDFESSWMDIPDDIALCIAKIFKSGELGSEYNVYYSFKLNCVITVNELAKLLQKEYKIHEDDLTFFESVKNDKNIDDKIEEKYLSM